MGKRSPLDKTACSSRFGHGLRLYIMQIVLSRQFHGVGWCRGAQLGLTAARAIGSSVLGRPQRCSLHECLVESGPQRIAQPWSVRRGAEHGLLLTVDIKKQPMLVGNASKDIVQPVGCLDHQRQLFIASDLGQLRVGRRLYAPGARGPERRSAAPLSGRPDRRTACGCPRWWRPCLPQRHDGMPPPGP
jgi:hypothetical protein